MNRVIYQAAPLLLTLAGCVTQEPAATTSLYDDWRAFHAAVAAAEDDARVLQYAQLMHPDETSTPQARLELAYLAIYAQAAGQPVERSASELEALLDSVEDEHELAPIRDMLKQLMLLQRDLASARVARSELGSACEATEQRLLALRLKQADVQNEMEVCTTQLEALKKIESMMSDADGTQEVLP